MFRMKLRQLLIDTAPSHALYTEFVKMAGLSDELEVLRFNADANTVTVRLTKEVGAGSVGNSFALMTPTNGPNGTDYVLPVNMFVQGIVAHAKDPNPEKNESVTVPVNPLAHLLVPKKRSSAVTLEKPARNPVAKPEKKIVRKAKPEPAPKQEVEPERKTDNAEQPSPLVTSILNAPITKIVTPEQTLYDLLIRPQIPDSRRYKKETEEVDSGINYLQTASNFKQAISNLYVDPQSSSVGSYHLVFYRFSQLGVPVTKGQVSLNCELPEDFFNDLAAIPGATRDGKKLVLNINNSLGTTKAVAQIIVAYMSMKEHEDVMKKTIKQFNSRFV